MNKYLCFLFFITVYLSSCSNSNKLLNFDEQFTKSNYQNIAKEKGVTNTVWINRLFDYKVNINKFDEFKKKGIDLTKVQANDYLTRSLLTDVIIEGRIISKKENPSSEVIFHTTYSVKVEQVIKQQNWNLADTVTLKIQSGPVRDKYMVVSSGADHYKTGEQVLLYLETMERTFKTYEEQKSANLKKINADRTDLNVFQALKKYLIKDNYIKDRTNGKIEEKKIAIKKLKQIVRINNMY